MTRRHIALFLLLLTAGACAGGHRSGPSLAPSQRLHAAVRAAQAVYDPDSAGGTGYGSTAALVRRMGPEAWGTPQPWPDDNAFRPGVVYVATLSAGRSASLWTFEPSGKGLYTVLDGPAKRVTYRTDSVRQGDLTGRVVIRPGVLSGDMIRAALEHAGFHGVTLNPMNGGRFQDGVRPLLTGGTIGSVPGAGVGFITFRSVADARRESHDMGLAPHHVSVILGTAWIHYGWKAGRPDRSLAFRQAIAELRRDLRTE